MTCGPGETSGEEAVMKKVPPARPVSNLDAMIAGMAPQLLPGGFVFCTVSHDTPDRVATLRKAALATFAEKEGLSLVLPEAFAVANDIPTDQTMRCITLEVQSSLEGVGLTAAVATALAEAGIACNMIAAFHHDHVFVPAASADKAMTCLTTLQDTWAERNPAR